MISSNCFKFINLTHHKHLINRKSSVIFNIFKGGLISEICSFWLKSTNKGAKSFFSFFVQSTQESDLANFTWRFESNCEIFSTIKPPLFNENWCFGVQQTPWKRISILFLKGQTKYKDYDKYTSIFKWFSGQSRNRSIRGLWDCHNVWEPLRRGHQGPLERWWHHGMLWQTERISAYRFCQIVSEHFIIFSFFNKDVTATSKRGSRAKSL